MATDCDLETDLPLQQSIEGIESPPRPYRSPPTQIPTDLLREVRAILEDPTSEPPPAEKLRYIRDLLRPFLTNL